MYKNIRFLRNTGPDSLSNHKAAKPTKAFRWWADDGPLIIVFGPSLPSSTEKTSQSWTHSEKKLSKSSHGKHPIWDQLGDSSKCHYATFHWGIHCLLRQNDLQRKKNTIFFYFFLFFWNYNLWPLNGHNSPPWPYFMHFYVKFHWFE